MPSSSELKHERRSKGLRYLDVERRVERTLSSGEVLQTGSERSIQRRDGRVVPPVRVVPRYVTRATLDAQLRVHFLIVEGSPSVELLMTGEGIGQTVAASAPSGLFVAASTSVSPSRRLTVSRNWSLRPKMRIGKCTSSRQAERRRRILLGCSTLR